MRRGVQKRPLCGGVQLSSSCPWSNHGARPLSKSIGSCGSLPPFQALPWRFGGSSADYKVASFQALSKAVFFPNWVARESAIGRSPLWFEGFGFYFSNWVEMREKARGHLRHKVWIRLHHWPILCWNEEDVKAAVYNFGELWEIDSISESLLDVSFFRARIRGQHVRYIPEAIHLMVEDRRFEIPVEVGSCEDANPILLGENIDERLGLVTVEAQDDFIRRTGFSSVPTFGDQGTSRPLGRVPYPPGGSMIRLFIGLSIYRSNVLVGNWNWSIAGADDLQRAFQI
uniref:DUF4283 domain-containing protein n=1 Tax=Ananas comosus var. bracteatus TaxID=296719 RepID=A0A6V7PKR1_ANACO|nr:unnamed protein product [Ananas comosus var. bracteatus]